MNVENEIIELNKIITLLKKHLEIYPDDLSVKLELRSFESRYEKIKHYI